MEAGQYTIHRELIIQCQKGDRLAQNKLYGLYAKAMYNICRRMMRDEDEAKDMLQDVFVDVFTKLETLKNIDTFSAWIKRITVNKCINSIKKKKIFAMTLEESGDIEADSEDSGDDYIIQYEARRVMAAIDQISDGCRTVLNLYIFEGYDHKEIAGILSISESASKSQYCKAKMKIKKILEAQSSKSKGYGKG